jgi:hypothetical protein
MLGKRQFDVSERPDNFEQVPAAQLLHRDDWNKMWKTILRSEPLIMIQVLDLTKWPIRTNARQPLVPKVRRGKSKLMPNIQLLLIGKLSQSDRCFPTKVLYSGTVPNVKSPFERTCTKRCQCVRVQMSTSTYSLHLGSRRMNSQ